MPDDVVLYGAKTGNCLRVAIALEELAIAHRVVLLDLGAGEQRTPDFLALNPGGKVPVLRVRSSRGPPLVLAQSNAILLYLAQQAGGRLLPREKDPSAPLALERFFFFVTDVIAPSHASFFLRSEGCDEGRRLMEQRTLDALLASEGFLENARFMAGQSFTLADIAAATIVAALSSSIDWTGHPRLHRWFACVMARPGVKRGMTAFD
ncbi:glutathione S-transferase family protein [Paraburkholderia sp. BL25I1N1]|uniref:glutathione S-transferase family protein n=1 Tax=Paraburkholderia sp. BL25I1N1 TaxID=1938804 RepID=UPI000D065122|nr:glutathione S-transferase family protein [Paraburkholderia sp. BL25I1N1]PRY04568.1 GST-like protein [Paraburkholderia sp. BL25I1N1]